MSETVFLWKKYGEDFASRFFTEVDRLLSQPFHLEEDKDMPLPEISGLDVWNTLKAVHDCFNVGEQLKSFGQDFNQPENYGPEEAAKILFEMVFAVEPPENPKESHKEHIQQCLHHIKTYLALTYAFIDALKNPEEFTSRLDGWTELIELSPQDPEVSESPEDPHIRSAEDRYVEWLIAEREAKLGKPLSPEEKLLIVLFGARDYRRNKKERGN